MWKIIISWPLGDCYASFNTRSLDQAIHHLFGLLERLAQTNKLNSGSGLLKYLDFFEFLNGEQSNTESVKQALRKEVCPQ